MQYLYLSKESLLLNKGCVWFSIFPSVWFVKYTTFDFMAVEGEDLGFGNMGFVPFEVLGSQDWFVGDDFQKIEPFVPFNNFASSSSSFCNNPLQSEFVRSLYSDLERQRVEMDGFLQLEGHILRRSIMQEQTLQNALLIQKMESRIKSLLLSKDEDLVTARNKTAQLQALLDSEEYKAKEWEKKAVENEAMVFNLNNKLIRAVQNDDTVSFCGSTSEEESNNKLGCKLCRVGKTCVVFLPCRHLCCCRSCEPLLGHCVVCQAPKVATLEVLLE